MTETNVPAELTYTPEHEWVRRVSPTTVRIGITDFAQEQLGDVVFVQLPDVGSDVEAGESFAEVESTKSVSDIFGPLNGTIAAVNDELESTPDLVNSEPYEAGWLVEIAVEESGELDAQLGDLLDADGYRQVIDG
ncbi:MAG TPA: glycine cleavage system protein GcvH [Gordonia polyisoprenivorans]|uniref:Glycine cleavage system H protein n=1 Tax=Gordonia polyisoprenivorans TaxID=84595 RepID=A0A846WTX4_9ACTN|nr:MULTISPECIES: glycine cleavage system protein GcvH [Gordonia]MBE7193232.1 glycine cleavage system protein GcvH [Gordonia polyisoprenivorans]MDF3283326.1 glycine cleavage system protein GcvH [Gordonia sp. N1V]NKY04123.1 glycine cleavage system protein GcvH [Gordonia polyisoprenivorans]OPX15093.1 glycine cleavage system protein H [Gordonia sp. i37]OZC30724.1 glycine cleavage system protein H [Gordonia polyisoprenivorans]